MTSRKPTYAKRLRLRICGSVPAKDLVMQRDYSCIGRRCLFEEIYEVQRCEEEALHAVVPSDKSSSHFLGPLNGASGEQRGVACFELDFVMSYSQPDDTISWLRWWLWEASRIGSPRAANKLNSTQVGNAHPSRSAGGSAGDMEPGSCGISGFALHRRRRVSRLSHASQRRRR